VRILVIESATEACSVALFEGEDRHEPPFAHAHEILGRGHAERLVPMIACLPDKGRADRIAVSLGPGSFTGVRIGLATARALGLAWQAEVVGYPTLAMVATGALVTHAGPVTVCMNGGHGEWFVQDFTNGAMPESEVASLAPDVARRRGHHRLVAGSRAHDLAGRDDVVLDLLPDASLFPALPAPLLTATLAPLYGRPPDARLPA
jgi:tRNA threonylcarbamoyl adenosine modification protein YeaZ